MMEFWRLLLRAFSLLARALSDMLGAAQNTARLLKGVRACRSLCPGGCCAYAL